MSAEGIQWSIMSFVNDATTWEGAQVYHRVLSVQQSKWVLGTASRRSDVRHHLWGMGPRVLSSTLPLRESGTYRVPLTTKAGIHEVLAFHLLSASCPRAIIVLLKSSLAHSEDFVQYRDHPKFFQDGETKITYVSYLALSCPTLLTSFALPANPALLCALPGYSNKRSETVISDCQAVYAMCRRNFGRRYMNFPKCQPLGFNSYQLDGC
jgi:hypothetical protein